MRALICGITGQDGAYLSRHLLTLGYEVFGISREHNLASATNLIRLGIQQDVTLLNAQMSDAVALKHYIDQTRPDEIYNLSGQSSVAHSYHYPAETLESLTMGNLNILEILRTSHPNIKFFHASSGECFGDTGLKPATESTAFAPESPYAIAKASAHWMVRSYRDSYGLFACSGIMFIHESPLRSPEFVVKKICNAAAQIAAGQLDELVLGNTSVRRDWGWAPEYVEGMWKMLQQSTPEDYILCTGQSFTLKQVVEQAFKQVGLDAERYVRVSDALIRPRDADNSVGSPVKANQQLDWHANTTMPTIIAALVDVERAQLVS